MIEQILNGVSVGQYRFCSLFFSLLVGCAALRFMRHLFRGLQKVFKSWFALFPYLVAMFVAIKIFRASGAMEVFIRFFTCSGSDRFPLM